MNTPAPLTETTAAAWPRAVLFDLLTALLDSWTVWNSAAGSEAAGRDWRAEYLRLTYGCGAYQPYEDLVREAARSEEHTSELQSLTNLVCRLLLGKKKTKNLWCSDEHC